MTNLQKRIMGILSILLLLSGICYYYEGQVTRLIHESMTSRSREMVEDAAKLVGSRLQQDKSKENIRALKDKLSQSKLFGAKGRMQLVNGAGEEVFPRDTAKAFNCNNILPEVVKRHPNLLPSSFLANGSYVGVYTLEGHDYCLTYAPIGVNDWYVVALVPLRSTFHYGQQAVRELFKLMLALIAIFGLVAAYLIYDTKKKQEQLYAMAYGDDITGLGNKNRYFAEMSAMAKKPDNDQVWCLLLINLHNFKWVNDSFGVAAGNKVLNMVARVIEERYCHEKEIPMRLGSDLFLVLKPLPKWEEPLAYAEHILSDIKGISLEDKNLNLIASAGGVLFTSSSVIDGHTVLDAAMHAQEEAARKLEARVVFYTEDVIQKFKEENKLLEELKEAISKGALEVFYQAKYSPKTNEIVGAEALVRWRHPERGLIPPGLFIPLVEKRGFIWEVTQIVYGRVCQDIENWHKLGLKVVPVSVNVSSHDLFQNTLISSFLNGLNAHGIKKGEIELELTESTVMTDLDRSLNMLKKLKEIGFKLNIDDFGTGYSALSYLQEGVFDVIKLDRSFLLQRDKFKEEGEKLITSIIALAKNLDVKCVCEGAETKEQVEFLRDVGCDAIQGYYYAKPEPENEFRKRLEA